MGLKAITPELPILIKLIDATDNLSIQVHPDDKFALENENDNRKTEMWLILECEPNTYLYYGVNQNVTKEELHNSITDGNFLSLLRKAPVQR